MDHRFFGFLATLIFGFAVHGEGISAQQLEETAFPSARDRILEPVSMLADSRVAKTAGPTLDNNELTVTARTRDCVLTCTAPQIVRRGDKVEIALEVSNPDKVPHGIADWTPGTSEGPDDRFRVWVQRGAGRIFHPSRQHSPIGIDGPDWEGLNPGESFKSKADITPMLAQLHDDEVAFLWVSVTLDGEIILPWPNRYGSVCSVGMVIAIMSPEEYDAIVVTEEKARQATTRPSTLPGRP